MDAYEERRREAVQLALRQLQFYWYGMLCLPLVYLLVCVGVRNWWFLPRNRVGLYPLAGEEEMTVIVVFGLLAGLGQALLLHLRGRFGAWLDEAAANAAEFVRLLRRRLLVLGAICDGVSFLGLLYFLMDGDLRGMLAFGVLSYILYAEIYPHDRLADKLKPSAAGGDGAHPEE
ncbi:MAG: hypothetical protein NTW86_21230 [Candidatus Sumerlaeota bacterium]|nr:hypothetical protein [Candidatus Sumerlaeota bacterium]